MPLKMMGEYRPMTESEQALLSRLLESPFPGRDQLRAQLRDAMVRTIDEDGSFSIQVSRDQKADVLRRVPVEADGIDLDGMMIRFLLHVVKGIASELEIYRDDSLPVQKLPAVDQLQIFAHATPITDDE